MLQAREREIISDVIVAQFVSLTHVGLICRNALFSGPNAYELAHFSSVVCRNNYSVFLS